MMVVGGSVGELSVQVRSEIRISETPSKAAKLTKTNTMNSKLYIGNLSFTTTEDALRTAFGPCGDITDVYVAMDRETGRPRGFAFITFSKAEEAQAAIAKMDGADLDGRNLKVSEAKPKA